MRLIILAATFASLVTSAQIYRWTDSAGTTHFSDQPHVNANVIQLSPSTISTLQQQNSVPPIKKLSQYQTLQIIRPTNEATIFDNQGIVAVKINLQPALQNNDQILFFLDNKLIAKSQSLAVNLTTIDRGTHILQVKVVDNHGNLVKISNAVVFYLHRALVQ